MHPAATDLQRLYDAHAPAVFRYLLGFVHCEADARDLLQELFMRLNVRPLPAEVVGERAFVWRMAHNLAIDFLRRQGARQHSAETAHTHLPGLFESAADPDSAEFARQVEAALAALPPEQRSIAQMKLWEGLTFEEIAAAQNIPLNTAASRYRYAIDKLRARLRPLYEEIQP